MFSEWCYINILIKKILSLIFFIFCINTSSVIAQQLPLHNQYVYNPLIINPAFAGVPYTPTISVSTRSQWIGFSEGISTLSLSGNYALTTSQGLGATLFQDNTGAMTITALEIDYSFKFPLSENYNMSLGLGLVPYQYLYNSDMVTSNMFDPTLDISEKKTSVDANFGLFVYSDFLFGGISVLNMIESSNISSINTDEPNQLVRHYYTLFGYKYFNQSSKIGLEQSVLMRNTAYSGAQFDFNIKTNFNELFWILCGYRTNQEFLAGFGIKYGRLAFIYNIDINYGNIGDYSNSSHEFGVIFYLNKNKQFDWGSDLNK